MIFAQSLVKIHPGEPPVTALQDVDLNIQAGEQVAIVGKSGSGKSTLLNLLAGLDHPTAGRLEVENRELAGRNRSEMAAFRRQTVGVIFQAFQLIPQRTALQNVELPLLLSRVPRGERLRRAREGLDRVGLAHRLDHFPYALSGGEQQRVAIARALVHRPAVVLADEPTGNLDRQTSHDITELLLELCQQSQVTFVLVTHDDDVASRLCQRTLQMIDGRLAEWDPHASA